MNPRTINQIKSKIQNCNKKTDIDHVIVQTTNLYTIPVKPNTQNSQRQNKERTKAKKSKNSWYDTECKVLKRKLNQLNKIFNRNPTDQMKRNSFLTLQKRYKKLLKYKRKIYEEDIINKMENLYYRNKDDFWKMLKSMKRKDSNEDVIPIAKLNNHFKNLYNKETNYEYSEQVTQVTQTQTLEILNINIEEEEVKYAIKNIKRQKSPSI